MPRFTPNPTPNPNSIKITRGTGVFVEAGMLVFGNAKEAATHPLGRALFALSGVDNVFVVPDFLTITKRPEVDWKELWPAVAAVLEAEEA